MRNRGAGRGWRTLSRFALIGVIGGGAAACSTDASRLGDPFTNPFSSLSSEPSATGSLADETDTAPAPAIRTPRIQSGDLGAPASTMSPRPAYSRVAESEPISGSVAGMNPDASRMASPRIAPAAPAPKLQFGAAPKPIDKKAAEAEARKLVEAKRLAEAEARRQAEIDAKKELEARKLADAKKLTDAKKAAELKVAEVKAAESRKLAEAAEAKKAAEAKALDAKKSAEAKALEAKKAAEAAEAKRLAETKKAAEAKKLADAEAKKALTKTATKDAAKPDPAAERKAEAARKAEAEAKIAKAEASKEAAKKVAEAKAAEAEAKAAAKEAAKVAASKDGTKDAAKKVAEAKAAEAEAKAAAKEAAKAAKESVKETKVAEKEPEKPVAVKIASADPVSNPVTASDANESFRWPAKGRVINGYGSGGNEGINISVPEGTPVKAAEDGTVAYAGSDVKGYGKLVLVRHTNGYVSAYAHNGELDVRPGDKVKRGQTIAKSGATGNVTSPQLHFEIRKGATPVDPIPHLASN